MLRVMCEAARYEGNPLLKLSNTMKWGITFGDHEIAELERYLEIVDPLEQMFNELNSAQTNIQKIIPGIKVKTFYYKVIVCMLLYSREC